MSLYQTIEHFEKLYEEEKYSELLQKFQQAETILSRMSCEEKFKFKSIQCATYYQMMQLFTSKI